MKEQEIMEIRFEDNSPRIIIIGIGQLGSNLAIELGKRSKAIEASLQLILIDPDTVEERNSITQWFSPSHIGKSKCEVVGKELQSYGFNILTYNREFDIDFPLEEHNGTTLLIDCTDNATARNMIWLYSVTNNIPLLSLGNSTTGSGEIYWTNGSFDNNAWGYTAGSYNSIEAFKTNPPMEKIPPCELTKFRPLALNTVMAGIEAIFLFLGYDIAGRFPQEVVVPGIMSVWEIGMYHYRIILEGTGFLEEGESIAS